MRPALEPGDRLVVIRRRVRVGDVVAVRDPRAPGRIMVKRVAALDRHGATVLGDHADASTDSRHFGPVPLPLVTGVAVYRYFPASRAGWLAGRTVRSPEWRTTASTPSSRPTTSPG